MFPALPLALALLSCPAQQSGNIRVIDAATKQPIAGAAVFGVQEADAPVWGTFWSRVSAATGDDGWANLPLSTDEAQYFWRIVRAEGYAISGSMQIPREDVEPEIVELQRAVPAQIRVVDFLGRPVPLLHLGFCVGCGHTPDVASAVTDKGGRATLMCVGRGDRDIADIYPVGAGVQTDYLWVDWDQAFDGGFEALAHPGAMLAGRVLLPDGKPAAGYSVGIPEIHRGPWGRTDDAGYFRLFGLPARDISYIQVKDRTGETIAGFQGSRVGVERMLRLPTEKWGATMPDANASVSITVTVPESDVEHATVWPQGVPLQIWDPASGWCQAGDVPVGEAIVIALPPGSFELELGGGDSPYRRRRVGRIDVAAGTEPLVVSYELPPLRSVRLEVSGIDLASRVKILTAAGTWSDVTFDSIELHAGQTTGVGVIEAFPVPAEPFGLWLAGEHRGRDYIFFEMSGRRGAGDLIRAHPRAY